MLSTPKSRSLLHTREITFQGYAREDGLWDIEGHLRDFKTNPFQTSAKTWQPGEAFHDMWIRVTLDKEFVIKAIEAVMDGQPHAECTAASILLLQLINPFQEHSLIRIVISHHCTWVPANLGTLMAP